MKKLLLSLIFFLLSALVFPQPALADLMGCSKGTTKAYVVDGDLIIETKVTNAQPGSSSGYVLTYHEGPNQYIGTSTDIVSLGGGDIEVTWTIPQGDTDDFGFQNTQNNASFGVLELDTGWFLDSRNCTFDVNITAEMVDAMKTAGTTTPTTTPTPTPTPTSTPSPPPPTSIIVAGNNCPGVHTALGVIPSEIDCLVKWLLRNAIIIGSGLSFLLSLWGGISIILASGNPEKINHGKEILTSAITGLLIIIFSVFLLRFIGLDILAIPGFTP